MSEINSRIIARIIVRFQQHTHRIAMARNLPPGERLRFIEMAGVTARIASDVRRRAGDHGVAEAMDRWIDETIKAACETIAEQVEQEHRAWMALRWYQKLWRIARDQYPASLRGSS